MCDRGEGFVKSFGKDTKKITVNGCLFHCVINPFPRNEDVGFRVYSSKTSFFEVRFSWKGTWYINLHRPHTCASLIKYAIEQGWDFAQEKQTMKIEQGDFLIDKLGLDERG
ncbi:hypothetical protein Elgi_16050 [Paenibacillus elgii]|nr:hypothetical protein Elgi_16050 [Paenibacillus elgii]